jgi:hypothetical protein
LRRPKRSIRKFSAWKKKKKKKEKEKRDNNNNNNNNNWIIGSAST